MRSVSDAFLAEQLKSTNFPVTYIYYKRRYWDSVTSAYIYEADWTKIERSDVVFIDPIIQNLDTETLSEFEVSNVQVRLKNTANEWKETNALGKFAADGVSANGYEPYLMKFKIATGFWIPTTDIRQGSNVTGTEELITIFTGLANDWQFDSESGEVSIDIQGAERLLINGDATRVCTTVTNESLGTGDGTTKEFYTSNSGVGKIINCIVNSITLKAGLDYEVSQLNDIDNGAQITFAQAPASAVTITCSYEHWKKNQLLETLIENLVDEAGITSKSISSATLGSIQNNITQSSKSDFESGTNSLGSNTTTNPGKITTNLNNINTATLWNDFASGTLAENGWTNLIYYTDPTTFDIDNGQLRYRGDSNPTGGGIYKDFPSAIAFGFFQMKVTIEDDTLSFCWNFMNNVSASNPDDDGTNVGYRIQWGGVSSTNSWTNLSLVKGIEWTIAPVVLGTVEERMTKNTQYTITVIRDLIGEFKVYVNGVLKITARDSYYGARNKMIICGNSSVLDINKSIRFDDIYIPNITTITHQSQTIDVGSGITAWGNLTANYEGPISIFSIQTRTSANGTDWDGWIALSGNAIQSAVKRYIQVKITMGYFTDTANDEMDEPAILDYNIQFTSSNVIIALGNFSDMTCYDALQEHAKFCPDFEWGLDCNEQFFFRARNTSATPDITFVQNTNLSKVIYLKYDYENMYSIIRASFGSFVAEASDSDAVRTSMLEIIGKKVFEIGSGVLINKDTNIATGIASTYLARLIKKRRHGRIQTKYYPQIELSDTVSITFKRDSFSSEEPFIETLICNVIGTQHDPENAISEFEIEEIVS